jgi:diacylglycerol kinase family enzyme/membrane-associated phospholipid phosphatase
MEIKMKGAAARFTGFEVRLMGAVPVGQSVLLDRVLPTLGRFANHGRLWFATAGALSAVPQRTPRRAALRGLAALGLASSGTNLLAKALVDRRRPGLAAVPLIRQLRRVPASSSFPSGHAASAAAFATGVALESRWLALPVAGLAAGVAASRVVTGVHYPSDVVAGACLGVSAGLLTTRWWPTVGPEPAQAPPAGYEAPALETGKGLVLVVNTAARSADGGLAELIARELPEAEVLLAEEGDEARELLAAAAARATVLGVAGGDGTVNAAAQLALDADIPLLVVPGGTLNHFARDLGLDDAASAIDALRQGHAARVDVGVAGGRIFVNTFSIGSYVELVRAREQLERRLGKWPATLAGVYTVLREDEPCDVAVDGAARRIWLLFAGNCLYEPAGLAPSHRPRLDDADLDVRIVDAGRPLARVRLLAALATGTLANSRVYEYRKASQVTLGGGGTPLRFTVDGEVVDSGGAGDDGDDTGELTVTKRRGALIVYRPQVT